MAFDSSGGASKLAKVLTQRMKKCKESPLVLDFGEILPNMSLLTNTFPLEIPKGQYTICRSVSWNPAIPMTMTYGRMKLQASRDGKRKTGVKKRGREDRQICTILRSAFRTYMEKKGSMTTDRARQGSIIMMYIFRTKCDGSSPETVCLWHGWKMRRSLLISFLIPKF